MDKVSTPVDDDSFEVFSEFADVFSPELGCIDGFEANIHLHDGAVPKCVPARLPCSLCN